MKPHIFFELPNSSYPKVSVFASRKECIIRVYSPLGYVVAQFEPWGFIRHWHVNTHMSHYWGSWSKYIPAVKRLEQRLLIIFPLTNKGK